MSNHLEFVHARTIVMVGCLSLAFASCGGTASFTQEGHESDSIITAPGEAAGKWLVTLSYGADVPADATLALRQAVVPVFSTVRGGIYVHRIDMDDTDESKSPTLVEIESAMTSLGQEISGYKKSHPQSLTSVVVSITGHGNVKEGQYVLMLAGEMVSGDELASMILRLNADDTLVFMQSCLSGGFVSQDLPEATHGLAATLRSAFATQGRRLAAVTPVSDVISSPGYKWEAVVAQSLNAEAGDTDHDGILSYEEWRNAVEKAACSSDIYVPKAALSQVQYVPKVGMDPQFFEFNVSPDLPLVLTAAASDAYNQGTLKLPALARGEVSWFADTTATCDSALQSFVSLYSCSNEDLATYITNQSGAEQARAMTAASYRDVFNSPALLTTAIDLLANDADANIRLKAARLLATKNDAPEAVVTALAQAYQNDTNANVRQAALASLIEASPAQAYDVFVEALQRIANGELDSGLRYFLLQALARIGRPDSVPIFVDELQRDPNVSIRAFCVYALWLIGTDEAIAAIRCAAEHDPSEQVRDACAELLGQSN
jgi:hypothetical protein